MSFFFGFLAGLAMGVGLVALLSKQSETDAESYADAVAAGS